VRMREGQREGKLKYKRQCTAEVGWWTYGWVDDVASIVLDFGSFYSRAGRQDE
jgi:hypothetical protein